MPRCQRTFRRLPGSGAAQWTCPYCESLETYENVVAPDLLAYARQAEAACIRDFGAPDDAVRPTLLLLGLHPECVRETADRRYDIYLQHGSDSCQLRLQIGHEVFHRVCSQGRIFHWTHEMLACLMSVRLLRASGLEAYAAQMESDYRAQAGDFPFKSLATCGMEGATNNYPRGFYGCAFVTGDSIREAVGWSALRRLARTLGKDGAPDVKRWIASLSAEQFTAIKEIPGITTAGIL